MSRWIAWELLASAFADERATLVAAHAEELARVRRDEARDALQRLARSLLGADARSLASTVLTAPEPAVAEPQPPAASSPATPEPAPADIAESAAEVPETLDDEAEEPWVDSVLCTSCNDCLDINNRLFVYNANKQAVIGDPRAGTYAQLVQAAEKCPARCIHPGLPLDPNEPELETLIKRARPFN